MRKLVNEKLSSQGNFLLSRFLAFSSCLHVILVGWESWPRILQRKGDSKKMPGTLVAVSTTLF